MPIVLIALACALSLTSVTPVQSSDASSSVAAAIMTAPLAPTVLYRVTRDLDLVPIATETEHGEVANASAEHLQLDRGDYVVLEQTRIDERGVKRLRISFDPVDENSPSTYWINAADFGPNDVTTSIPSVGTTSSIANQSTIPDDDEYLETQEARRGGWGHSRRARRGNFCISHPLHARCCKSAVNYKLLAMGLIRTRVPGLRARTMANGLAKQGWKEVHCGARVRPSRGMTCTLVGRAADHTETFTGRCWYYGSKCTPEPMHQSNRQCISCKVPGRG